jgi:hypothetical protein
MVKLIRCGSRLTGFLLKRSHPSIETAPNRVSHSWDFYTAILSIVEIVGRWAEGLHEIYRD